MIIIFEIYIIFHFPNPQCSKMDECGTENDSTNTNI